MLRKISTNVRVAKPSRTGTIRCTGIKQYSVLQQTQFKQHSKLVKNHLYHYQHSTNLLSLYRQFSQASNSNHVNHPNTTDTTDKNALKSTIFTADNTQHNNISQTNATPHTDTIHHNDTIDTLKDTTPTGWVNLFNHSIQYYPIHTIISLMCIEGLSFTLINYALSTTTYQFTNLWLLAYILSWPIRRSIIVKLVCSPIIAVPLSYIIPVLRQVDLTMLLQSPVIQSIRTRVRSLYTKSTDTTVPSHTATQSRLHGITKHYGLSAFIAYRIVGALVLVSIYALLQYGVNVTALLQKLGINIDHQYIHQYNRSSVYVVSLICCALVFPLNIAVLPLVVQYLVRPVTGRISRLFVAGKK